MFDPEILKEGPVILFDGSCGLCNWCVKYVLKKEKKNKILRFAALQSDFGQKALEHFNLKGKTDSIVLIENGKTHIKSGAALRMNKYMRSLWPLMMGLLIVPPFIRDFVYDYIAKNRITWFGTSDYCDMMTPELKKRFLE